MKKDEYEARKILWIIPIIIIQYFQDILFLFAGIDNFGNDPDMTMRYVSLVYGRSRSMGEASISASIFGVTLSIASIVIFGTSIYKKLNQKETYYLIRQREIVRWYYTSLKKLAIIVLAYSFTQIFSPLVICLLTEKSLPDLSFILVVCSVLISVFLFNTLFIFIVNTCAIKYGSVVSFIISYGIMVVSLILSDSDIFGRFPFIYFYPTEIGLIAVNPDQGVSLFFQNLTWFG